MTRDPELAAFKMQIDLRAYAADRGYALDPKESWRGSSVMRHENGDKIIVHKDGDGHYVYFSVRDAKDNGTIIDFVMRRRSCSLGQARRILRLWIAGPLPVRYPFNELARSSKDRLAVERSYHRTRDALNHPYLEQERHIAAPLLTSMRILGRVRIDARGNAIFPHFDQEGLCGYEIKNRNFTGFARGGEKGLWLSNFEPRDNRIVIAESAIDALSYAQLFAQAATRYASIGGQMNPRQPALVAAICAEMPEGSEVVAAMDSDDAGRGLGERVNEAITSARRKDLRFIVHLPQEVKDWNDALRRYQARSFNAGSSPGLR